MIQSTSVDPCDINILNNIDKPKTKQSNQSFYCHAVCLQSRLHNNIKGYFVMHISDA